MILEFRNPVTITSLEKFKFEVENLFEQSRFDVPVLKCWKANQVVQLMLFGHIRQTRQWWKERQDTKHKNCSRVWNRWQYEIYYWRRFRTFGINVTKSKERYVPRNWIWWMLQEAFYKVRTGEIFDELEVEGISRERFTEMQADRISH